MALTINTTPSNYESVYSDLVFGVTSSISDDSLRVKGELNYSTDGGINYNSFFLWGIKIGNSFNFDVSGHLQGIVTFDDTFSTINFASKSAVTYFLTVTEWTSDELGVLSASTNPLNSPVFFALNTRLKAGELIFNFDMNDPSRRFLSDMPLSQIVIRKGERLPLHWIDTSNNDDIHIINLVTHYNDGTPMLNEQIRTYPSGSMRGAFVLYFSDIASNVRKMECYLSSVSGGAAISETITMTVDHKELPMSRRLTWLNHRGGFDAHTFIAQDFERISVEKQKYESLINKSPTLVQLQAIETETVTMLSDYLSVETRRAMKQLLSSPCVYLDTEDGRTKVEVTNTDISVKQANELMQVSITVSLPAIVI